jgi:predicted metallopeptidase
LRTRQVKKLLRKYLDYWVHWTGLGYWDIRVIFKKGSKKRGKDEHLAGKCFVTWKYVRATIIFYPQAMKHLPKEEIEAVVIHELMHIFLNEMDGTLDHEERVATQLQKAFSWVTGSL